MSTMLDKLKWEKYWLKRRLIFDIGICLGLVHGYEKEFIENLRHVYYGGLPASVILLCHARCNGYCYDRALLPTFGFGNDDFKIVTADVDVLSLNPEIIEKFADRNYEHYGSHCFVERTKSDGSVWVYDTTKGLVIERHLFYLLERPKITSINDKKTTVEFCEWQDIKNANIENDKYAAPIQLQMIEQWPHLGARSLYEDWLKEEIQIFKDNINYDLLCKEIHDDMVAKGLRKEK